jgi:hypothetical protein
MAHSIKKTTGTEAEILAIGTAGTACPAGVYLSDNNKIWLGAMDGTLLGPFVLAADAGPNFYGDYANDTEAGLNGVPLQGIYFLTRSNSYGQPEGMSKKRTEQ